MQITELKDDDLCDLEEQLELSVAGKKKYGRLVRLLREGYISLCIYKNQYEKRVYFDVVIYRKIKTNGKVEYKRGANLKPSDLPALQTLLKDAQEYLDTCLSDS